MSPQYIVPLANLIAIILAGAALFLIPVGLLLWWGIKKRITMVPLLAGFLSFFVSQPLTRMILLNLLSLSPAFQQFVADHFFLYAILIGGLTAGLFEETARLVGATLLKKHRGWKDACSFGWGHGFCEVILITGMAQVNNLILALMLNSGISSEMLGLPAETLAVVAEQLAGTSPWMFGVSVLERVFAVIYHLSATILIFWGVNQRKRLLSWGIAVGCHTLFNALAVILSTYSSIWVAELAMAVMSVSMLLVVRRLRDTFPLPEFSNPNLVN